MKAEIDAAGRLVITPQNSTETYALSAWVRQSREFICNSWLKTDEVKFSADKFVFDMETGDAQMLR